MQQQDPDSSMLFQMKILREKKEVVQQKQTMLGLNELQKNQP